MLHTLTRFAFEQTTTGSEIIVTEHVSIDVPRGTLSSKQREVLLNGIDTDRIARRRQGKGTSGPLLSYLEQADVRAHADRIFGHGGWDCETLDVVQAFEEQASNGNWNVGYRVTMQVTIYDPAGLPVCRYSETAVGTPMGPMADRGDAHDMAVKTAASDAMKRCFINLGDQFGLSLYWKGRTAPVVLTTLVDGGSMPDQIPAVPAEETPESSGPEPSPEHEQPVMLPDTGQPEIPEAAFEMCLDEIRVAAVVPDSGVRLLALASIKQRYPEAVLNRTTVVRGSTITLGALVDRASVGEFVPAEEATS